MKDYVVDLRGGCSKLGEDGLKCARILADESLDVSQLRMVENGAQLLDA